MRTTMKKMTCRALVVSLLALSFTTAKAGMIGADQVAPASASSDRAMVMSVLNRADTAAQLQAEGVDPAVARERVQSMSDQEVQQLAQHMQTAPAGASLHLAGWIAVIAIAAVVWYFAMRA